MMPANTIAYCANPARHCEECGYCPESDNAAHLLEPCRYCESPICDECKGDHWHGN